MKLGARIFKTGISIVLSIYLASLLNLDGTMIAAIAAAMSVFPSVYRSWEHLQLHIKGNVIGAVFASIGYLTLGNSPFSIGFVVMIVIATNLKLKLDKTIGLSVVMVIAMMQVPDSHYIVFALERFGLVMLGIFSSLVINFVFLPPKYEKKLYGKLKNTSERLLLLLRISIDDDNVDDRVFNEEKKVIYKGIEQSENMYDLYKDEFQHVFKKKKFHEKKKLIIFKRMISVINKEIAVMKLVKKYLMANPYIPKEVKDEIKESLVYLTSYDEKIFFKYEKQLQVKQPHEMPKDLVERNKLLAGKLISFYNQENLDEWYHVLPIIASLIELAYDLEKLDRLVDNYLRTSQS